MAKKLKFLKKSSQNKTLVNMIIYSDKKLREVKYFKVNAFNDFRGQIWTFWEKKYFKNIKFNLDKFTLSKKKCAQRFPWRQKIMEIGYLR